MGFKWLKNTQRLECFSNTEKLQQKKKSKLKAACKKKTKHEYNDDFRAAGYVIHINVLLSVWSDKVVFVDCKSDKTLGHRHLNKIRIIAYRHFFILRVGVTLK